MKNDKPTGIRIDETTHEEVPALSERVTYAALAAFFGFLLIQIIGFWVFPGLGWLGGITVFSYFPKLSFVRSSFWIYAIAWLLACAAAGWIRGRYVVKRLKDYIQFWKFW